MSFNCSCSSCWRRSPLPYGEARILAELSRPLHAELLRDLGARLRHLGPLLQAYGDECVGYLITVLEPAHFDAGDEIYRRGDQATEMYFLTEGTVELSDCGGRAPTLERGDLFGELGLFPDEYGGVRAETAKAQTWVSVFALRAGRRAELAERFPAVVQRLRELAAVQALDLRLSGGGAAGVPVRPDGRRSGLCRIALLTEQVREHTANL